MQSKLNTKISVAIKIQLNLICKQVSIASDQNFSFNLISNDFYQMYYNVNYLQIISQKISFFWKNELMLSPLISVSNWVLISANWN